MEPFVTTVEQVEPEVHLLNQGGVERFRGVVGRKGRGARPPTVNGLAPGFLGVSDGGGRWQQPACCRPGSEATVPRR